MFEELSGLAPVQRTASVTNIAAAAALPSASSPFDDIVTSDPEMKKIFILLRAETGHDLSDYKAGTIQRRIERRMIVRAIPTLDGYVQYLQQTPAEVEALFHDVLIGVTSFFRDQEEFLSLETQAIPKLFEGKKSGAAIRVWTAACSTGEEAYSIAILLVERMAELKQSYAVQIFASDIDGRAIATARVGRYPKSIAANVSAERLAKFFTVESDGSFYRINKGIRELLVFSQHDLIKDPPFSKLDLITCRNLMIYLGTSLQQKLIPLFHYSLNPGGVLFLGTSEGVGRFEGLFSALDRRAKVYQRTDDPGGTRSTVSDSSLWSKKGIDMPFPRGLPKAVISGRPPLRDLTELTLLKHAGATGVLVDSTGHVLYLHGRSGIYLEPAQGEAGFNNISTMARDGLRPRLSLALPQAVAANDIVRVRNLRVKANGHFVLSLIHI